jgi:hypothetical protein
MILKVRGVYEDYENASKCPALCLPADRQGRDEGSDFENPIDRTFLSGNSIFYSIRNERGRGENEPPFEAVTLNRKWDVVF